MKKIYSSMMMLAAGAMVATAANVMNVQNFTGKQIDRIPVLKTEMVKHSRVNHANDAYKVSAKAAIDASNLEGQYICSSFEPGPELLMSSTVKIFVNGNDVILDGIAKWDQEGSNWNPAYVTPLSGIKGTFEGDKITVPAGQVVGRFTDPDDASVSADIIVLTVTEDGEYYDDQTPIVFTINGDKITTSQDLVVYAIGAGWLGWAWDISMAAPNASLTYDWWQFSQKADILNPDKVYRHVELPMYYEFQSDAFGESVQMSSPSYYGGYFITWEYDPDENVLAGSEMIVETAYISALDEDIDFPICAAYLVDATDNNGNPTKAAAYLEPEIYASVNADKTEIVWPTGQVYDQAGNAYDINAWAILDPVSGYGYGYNGPATLKKFADGVQNVTSNSNDNAPVEYYNIQGMKVSNPAKGQLLIRRQGSNVQKIVVR